MPTIAYALYTLNLLKALEQRYATAQRDAGLAQDGGRADDGEKPRLRSQLQTEEEKTQKEVRELSYHREVLPLDRSLFGVH